MLKYALIGSAVVIAAMAVAIAGTQSDEPATAEATEVTTQEVAAEPVDRSQELADQYAETAPKELAVICRNADTIGFEKTADMAGRILGQQIISEGGDVDATVDALLDRC